MEKIQPRPTTLSEPYWQGCREGELRLQHCQTCGKAQFYPRLLCSHCQSKDLSWVVASGQGQIASYTVVRRGVSEAYPAPYIVALIHLAEGPRLMSHIVDTDPDEIAVGDHVQVMFTAWSQEMTLPVFRISNAEDTHASK